MEPRDLSGTTYERLLLRDGHLRLVDLSGTWIHQADLSGMRLRGVDLTDVTIDGEISNVVVNGVDVAPFVEAELDRRDPDRVRMRATDPAGFRAAWDILERRWADTVAVARALDPELLHQRVDDEWSFVETLRHLVYATDAWVSRVILGDPDPFDPLDLPFDTLRDLAWPHPTAVRPSLDEVLALRADRWATVRRLLDGLTAARLDGSTEPVDGPGWPPADRYSVKEALLVVLNEEWHHRLFAERDLATLSG